MSASVEISRRIERRSSD